MSLKFNTLSIKGFRSFKELRIGSMGRVNLITGRNNTGKSSVLEALRLLASNASPRLIQSILLHREESLEMLRPVNEAFEESETPSGIDSFIPLSGLFRGFPELTENIAPIEIEANGASQPMKLCLLAGFSQEDLFAEEEGLAALTIETEETQRILSLNKLNRSLYRRTLRSEPFEGQRFPCLYVSPYGGEQTMNLAKLWDNIALSDQEADVVRALQIIEPDIMKVSMIGGEGFRESRSAIVRARNLPRPVPLRSFGDGLNRLFGITLSLVNARGGMLLIDEFENGMHHTIQADAWRIIFKLASDLDIQVVATSHSWDAIEAFQQVACENKEEGVLVRLTQKGEAIIPTIFREDELAIATREGIEVR